MESAEERNKLLGLLPFRERQIFRLLFFCVIRDPRMNKELLGTENDKFTLSVDLASVVFGAAGIKQPARMQGRDISTLYRYTDVNNVGAEPWRKEFFYEMPPLRLGEDQVPSCQALVRKDFKLMWWPFYQQHQLFDLKKDPFEMNDLLAGVSMENISASEYSDFEYRDVAVEMLRHMHRLHKSVL